MTKKTSIFALFMLIAAVLLVSSCSIKELAMNTVIDSLAGSGGGSVFTGDDDPELIGDALPFALKMYEILLTQSPEHDGLLLTTGMGFVMYANAFIQAPSDRLPDHEFEERNRMRKRAKNMYLRGRDYLIDALEVRHPGFREAAALNDLSAYLPEMTDEDIPYLYWCSLGWFGAIAIDAFDMALGMTRDTAISLMGRALEIDETWGDGSIHEFYITYYGSLPAMLGGSEEKAREHFGRAVELSGGIKSGPYVALATSVSVKNHDSDEFIELLNTALEVENDDPDSKLVEIINQEKAAWLLDHIDNYFLLD